MEEWLVTKAKTDKSAFMELYKIYYPKLFVFLLARTRNKEIAEDIAQETFAKAIAAIKNFEYKGHSFGSWLFKIAQNEMISDWRKRKRLISSSPEEIEQAAGSAVSAEREFILQEASAEENHRLQRVLEALEQLSLEEKNIITLKYISNLSYKEISHLMKKRQNTLAVALYRALKKLKEILEQYETQPYK